MHFVDLAIGHSPKLDAHERHALIDGRDVSLVAREPVDILGKDHIEALRQRAAEHAIKLVTSVHGRAGDGMISERFHDREAMPRGVVAAKDKLILARAIVLLIG